MAAALSLASDTAHSVKEHVSEFLSDDPILRIANGLLKIGVAIAAIGIIATYSAPSFQKAATNERNDMEDALGLPRTQLPGSPRPPPPPQPYYVTDIAGALWNYTNLSTTDAVQNAAYLNAGLVNLRDLFTQSVAAKAPQAAQFAILQLEDDFQSMILDMTQDPPDWNALAKMVGGPESITFGTGSWQETQTITSKPLTWNHFNAVESAFGIKATFDTSEQNASSSGTTDPWGMVFLDFVDYVALVSGNGILGLVANYGSQAANDVYQAAATLYNDVAAVAGDIAKGLQVIGAGIVNFPRILGDTVGMVFNWTLGQLFAFIGPFLTWVGIAMAIAGGLLGFAYKNVWPRLERRITLNANARLARLWNRFDKWNKSRRKVQEIWTQKSTEGMIASANANPVYVDPAQVLPEPSIPTPPVPSAGPDAVKTPEEGGAGVSPGPNPPEPPAIPGPPEPTATAPPEVPASNTPAENSHETPTPLSETPVPPEGTTPAAEEFLGANQTRAPSPEELRKMAEEAEEQRRKTRAPESTDEPTKKDLLAMTGSQETFEEAQEARRSRWRGNYVKPVRTGGRRLKLSSKEIEAVAAVNEDGRKDELLQAAAERQEREQEESVKYRRKNRVPSMDRTIAMSEG